MAKNCTTDIDPQTGPTFIESKLAPDNSYGRNGYTGPSSRPLKDVVNTPPSAFAPKDDEAKRILKAGGMSFTKQTRVISDKGYVPAHGMKSPKSDGPIPDNGRPVTRKI
jgi:hypothetical protein